MLKRNDLMIRQGLDTCSPFEIDSSNYMICCKQDFCNRSIRQRQTTVLYTLTVFIFFSMRK